MDTAGRPKVLAPEVLTYVCSGDVPAACRLEPRWAGFRSMLEGVGATAQER